MTPDQLLLRTASFTLVCVILASATLVIDVIGQYHWLARIGQYMLADE